jgi:carboxymethylenebutenolidase
MGDLTITGGVSTPLLRAYLAEPAGEGPFPAVLVLHEAFGLTQDIRRQADRIAEGGYLALALDLYSAGGRARCLMSTFRTLSAGEGPAVGDVDAGRTWLLARPDCTGRVGVVGFCQGGGFALLAATRGFDAVAANYGPVPKNAHEALADACPVVASYGRKDVAMRGAAATLEAVLTELDVPHDVKEYPGVGHSFLNQGTLGRFGALERVLGLNYDSAVADDAWERILAFFEVHLGAPPER